MKSKTCKTVPNSSKIAQQCQRALDRLIAEQGVAQTATFENLLGSGIKLWRDEKEFNAFLEHVNAGRRVKE